MSRLEFAIVFDSIPTGVISWSLILDPTQTMVGKLCLVSYSSDRSIRALTIPTPPPSELQVYLALTSMTTSWSGFDWWTETSTKMHSNINNVATTSSLAYTTSKNEPHSNTLANNRQHALVSSITHTFLSENVKRNFVCRI